MAFMARVFSLAGMLTTVFAQQLSDYKEVAPSTPDATGDTAPNPLCKDMAPAGEWRDVTEAECRQYATLVNQEFKGPDHSQSSSTEIPHGCSTSDTDPTGIHYKTTDQPGGTESLEYHYVCMKATCETVTCLERFRYWCEESKKNFGSNNNNVAAANSPKDMLVSECSQCTGADNTDICPTKLRLYDAAPEAGPTSELDKTSVAVSVPLGLASALVALGALVGVSRSRASNQPVRVEDAQDLLRE